MSYVDIAAALNTRLKTITGFSGKIGWPNTKYNPTASTTKYLEASLLPNDAINVSLASQEQQVQGIYQVLCKRRVNKGIGVLADADAVVALFKPGQDYTSNAISVRIRRAWSSPAYIDGDWYVVPVSVDWYTFA